MYTEQVLEFIVKKYQPLEVVPAPHPQDAHGLVLHGPGLGVAALGLGVRRLGVLDLQRGRGLGLSSGSPLHVRVA